MKKRRSEFEKKINERLLIKRTISVLQDYVDHKNVEMHVFAELLSDWRELGYSLS